MGRHKISDNTNLSAVFVVIVLKPGDGVKTGAQVEHVSSRQKTLCFMAGITPTAPPKKYLSRLREVLEQFA